MFGAPGGESVLPSSRTGFLPMATEPPAAIAGGLDDPIASLPRAERVDRHAGQTGDGAYRISRDLAHELPAHSHTSQADRIATPLSRI